MLIQLRLERKIIKNKTCDTPLGGLEPPTFRLTAERASRLRHRGSMVQLEPCYRRLNVTRLIEFKTTFDCWTRQSVAGKE